MTNLFLSKMLLIVDKSTKLLNDMIKHIVVAIFVAVLVLLAVLIWGGKTGATSPDPKATQDIITNEEKVGTAAEDKSKNNDKEGAVVTLKGLAEEDLGTASESQSSLAKSWYLMTLLTLSTVANGCIAVFIFRQTLQSTKLQRERIKLLSDGKYVEPEELQKTMRALNEKAKALDKQLSELKQNNDRTVQSLAQQTSAAISGFEKDNQQTGEKIQEIMNSLSVFKESLDDKDEEIKRYKEGHDSKLISKYILSYIKVRDQIIKMTNSDQLEFKNLEQLADRLSMEIDHAGVKEIEVSVGDKFLDEKYGGMLAAPKLVPTDVPENEGRIKSVDLAGYEFTGNDRNIILRPAKVSVYKLEQAK